MTRSIFFILFSSLLLIFISLFLVYGYENILQQFWNIPTMNPFFADIRTITGVNETLSYGFDPLLLNPGDPWNRAMNYPRIWQYIAQLLNLNQSHAIYFGFINISLFILGFLLFVNKIRLSVITGVALLLGFFSPATILAMERGNIDLIIFFLFSFSLCYISNKLIHPAIILFASILKIFPVFALISLIRFEKKIFLKLLLFFLAAFTLYFFITFNDIKLIINGTPSSSILSYGIKTIPNAFDMDLGPYFYIFIVFTSIWYCFKKSQFSSHIELNNEYIDSFRIGSIIYLMTFLVGINWDYRLIFLLFTIPQLTIWIRCDFFLVKSSSLVSMISLLLTMWFLNIKMFFNKEIFGFDDIWFVDEISNWILFLSLLFLFIVSLPNWIIKSNIAISSK
jgi:hypothetical protein